MATSATNGKQPVKGDNKPKTNRRPQKRRVSAGDVAVSLQPNELEKHEVAESIEAAQHSKITAMRDIIERTPPHDAQTLAKTLEVIIAGAAPEDATTLRNALLHESAPLGIGKRGGLDDELSPGWRDGAYPYRNLMWRKN